MLAPAAVTLGSLAPTGAWSRCCRRDFGLVPDLMLVSDRISEIIVAISSIVWPLGGQETPGRDSPGAGGCVGATRQDQAVSPICGTTWATRIGEDLDPDLEIEPDRPWAGSARPGPGLEANIRELEVKLQSAEAAVGAGNANDAGFA